MLRYLDVVQKLQRECISTYFNVSFHRENGKTYIFVTLHTGTELQSFALYDFFDKSTNDEVIEKIRKTTESMKK